MSIWNIIKYQEAQYPDPHESYCPGIKGEKPDLRVIHLPRVEDFSCRSSPQFQPETWMWYSGNMSVIFLSFHLNDCCPYCICQLCHEIAGNYENCVPVSFLLVCRYLPDNHSQPNEWRSCGLGRAQNSGDSLLRKAKALWHCSLRRSNRGIRGVVVALPHV